MLICGADEDDEPSWVPVTDLRPVSVPVFRPALHPIRLRQQRVISSTEQKEAAA